MNPSPLLLMLPLLLISMAGWSDEAPGGSNCLKGDWIGSDNLSVFPHWQQILESIDRERESIRVCESDVDLCGSGRHVAWIAKMRSLEGLPLVVQLHEINAYINAGKSAPSVKSESGAGQLSIDGALGSAALKYLMLNQAGFTQSDMAVTYLDDDLKGREVVAVSVMADENCYLLFPETDLPMQTKQLIYFTPRFSVTETIYRVFVQNQEE
ncbi:MAG: hypothetical protein ABW146_11940 [Candidatus Sedimenticola sp. 6PFRAG7]